MKFDVRAYVRSRRPPCPGMHTWIWVSGIDRAECMICGALEPEFTGRPSPPRMPRLPRKLIARRPGWAHPAIVRADLFEGRWERLRASPLTDIDTLDLMLKIEECDE